MQAKNYKKSKQVTTLLPKKQTLGFPKAEYKPHLKGKLTKVNKPTTLE